MNSILLCEGPDDLWFAAYYLNKVAGWDDCKDIKRYWPNYKVSPLNRKQQVQFYCKDSDCVAIWCVAGKDSFDLAISIIFNKFIGDYPSAPVDSIVILRDRDTDDEKDILEHFDAVIGNDIHLVNKKSTLFFSIIDGCEVRVNITPVIIPFDKCGAIETLLMNSIGEESVEGKIIVEEACKYIDILSKDPVVPRKYLKHAREEIKAKFAATVAATNPGHSTGLFQDLVMSCPWESSEDVKCHFDIIVKAVTS